MPLRIDSESAGNQPTFPLGFHIGGFVQAQYQLNQLSENQIQQGGEPLNQDEFLVRRGRLRVDRGWQWAAGTLELDANTVHGVEVDIRRAFASALYRGQDLQAPHPLVALSVGVLDIPFGFELVQSPTERVFMERSPGSRALFPSEADAGAKLSGSYGFARYALAFVNGEPLVGARAAGDPNRSKDLVGRFGADTRGFTEGFSVSGGVSFGTGKGFHPGQESTKDRIQWIDENQDGVADPTELFGIPGSAAFPSSNFKRWVVGLDAGLELKTPVGVTQLYGELVVASNYDRGLFVADPIVSGVDIREFSAYGAAVQSLGDKGFVGVRVSVYDPNSDFLEERRGTFVPKNIGTKTFSPVVGVLLPEGARFSVQYDLIRDNLARDSRGVPKDAKNDQFTARLEVKL
ncbi:MAG: hypothetical protein SFV15_00820 [Polyangiaceae bacterium]|nr:hypothetical protein [Polyangiaceae bacterium]